MWPLPWPGHLLGPSVCSTDGRVGLVKLSLFSTQVMGQVLPEFTRRPSSQELSASYFFPPGVPRRLPLFFLPEGWTPFAWAAKVIVCFRNKVAHLKRKIKDAYALTDHSRSGDTLSPLWVFMIWPGDTSFRQDSFKGHFPTPCVCPPYLS